MNAQPSLDFDVMRATRPLRRPVHAARLLLQDVHPAAPLLAALREGPAPRRRPRQAAEGAGRARMAHRVPPPPRRRARGGRRRRRPERRDRRGRAGRRRGARRRGPRARRAPARRGRPRRARELAVAGPRRLGVEVLAARRRSARSTGSCPSGRATRSTRSARRRIVYATGSIEQPLVFPGNDLPGVMLSGGALPAGRALRASARAAAPWWPRSDDRGLEAARALLDAGVEVAAVADLRGERHSDAGEAADAPRRRDAARRDRAARRGAAPQLQRRRARAARRGEGGDGERTLDCDLLVVSGRQRARPRRCSPRSGARTAYDAQRGTSRSPSCPHGLHAAGEVAGAGDLERGRALRRPGRRRGGARARLRRRRPARRGPAQRVTSVGKPRRAHAPCRRR